jgi:two-component system CheB/CheR fusion protein
MALRDQMDLAAYASLLAQDPGELHALQQDLLIGVTRFFRDPATFQALQSRLLPDLLRDRAATNGRVAEVQSPVTVRHTAAAV